MNFVDDVIVEKQLFPFTLTRSIADIRVGILTIREKWQLEPGAQQLSTIPSNLLPSQQIISALAAADANLPPEAILIQHPWHIFQNNDWAIRQDFLSVTAGRTTSPLSSTNMVISANQIFLEEGAKVEHCVLNAATGPIYVGKNAEIMEGSTIRGPFALCEGALIKMGSRIYGATTVGPYSLAGGEIKNSVIFGYSNKAHDGYLGDAVIGEWCNLGAGTSASNIKNTAGEIKIWNPATGNTVNAGLKCGLLMGDYSRCAINTSFNTGTVTGVCCNIFGDGLTPKYIKHFSWGSSGLVRYEFTKAMQDIENWKRLKKQSLGEDEIKKLKDIFDNF